MNAEMDGLLRQIAALELKLAPADPNEQARMAASESELVNLGLMRYGVAKESPEPYGALTETAARLCDAARASIWLFEPDRSAIRCMDLFESGPARHSDGAVIRAEALPRYFAALETGEIIDASNVDADPRTAEFAGAFLAPLEIGALLDVPVVDAGSLAGVLHIEHLGAPRQWTAQERLYAITLSSQISLAIHREERVRAAESEQRNEDLLRMAAETARIIAWEWNPDSGNMRWGSNPEWLLGPRPESGEYPDFQQLVHAEDLDSLLTHARACTAGGNGFADSVRLRRTDGKTRWVLVRGEAAGHGAGQHLIGIAVDNHNRRQAEIQSEQLSRQHRALLDNLPDLAWTKDLEGRFTAVNRAFAASLGREPGEIIGRADFEVMPPQVQASLSEQDEAVIKSRTTMRWEQQDLASNREGWTEIVKAPILDRAGKVIGVVGMAHDLTARKQVENQLAASEKRFRAFAELSADWYWKQDADLRLIERTVSGDDTSTTPTALSGSLGRCRWEIPGIDLTTPGWEAHKADLEARRPFRDFVFVVVNAGGERIWARLSGMPIFDAQGRFTGYHGVGRNITPQMRATEERHSMQETIRAALQEQQTLMETCPTGLAVLRDRRFVRCNPAHAHLLGYEPGELIGKSTRVMFADEEGWREVGKLLYPPGGASGPFSVELELVRKDGTRVWGLISGHVIDPQSNYGIFSLIDVTARRNLATALTEAKEAADSASRAKSGFLATMSHEIRTPMNGVLGMLELMELGGLEESQRETVRTVRGLANSLLSVIDDILDFSKIEAGQLAIRPETISLADLIKQSSSVYQGLASRKSLLLTHRIDPSLAPAHVGDGVRIRQILGNFLSNAVKFTETGQITVSIARVAVVKGEEAIRVCVEDTGIGISTEDQGKLFQPFVQVDSRTTRRFEGTGLGLSICKRLAEAMGGSVRMQSSVGKGTAMFLNLRLPVADISEIPSQEHLKSFPGGRLADLNLHTRPRTDLAPILVAEDHGVNLRLIEQQLGLLGYRTEAARDGVDALQKWRHGRYSLLITDCHMPSMDGYQLARAIRTIENERGGAIRLPIVACTANALSGDAEQCLAAGMSDYMTKPVALAALQAILARWLPTDECAIHADTGMAQSQAVSLLPLDPDALLDFSGGDKEVERDILKQFLEANETDSRLLLSAMEQRDETLVLHASHRVKGACRSIGAAPLADVCERIEKACKARDWHGVIGARESLETEIRRLAEHLRSRVGESHSTT